MDEGELRGYHAITLRLHDPGIGPWSLYWITNAQRSDDRAAGDRAVRRARPGTFSGRTPTTAFPWSSGTGGPCLTRDTCQWEQALSPDDGKTWETNWYMDLSRTG